VASDPSFVLAFTCLGQEWHIDNVPTDPVEQFVCSVYRRQHLSLVDLRHRLFMDKFRLDSTLPPTPEWARWAKASR